MGFRRAWRWCVAVAALACGQALAIGPDNQTPQPPLDGVVRILFDNNLGGGIGEFRGTGSVIDNRDVNGQGWLCVLSADHVVSANAQLNGNTVKDPGIAFGNSGNSTGNSSYMKAGQVFRWGSTGRVDLALLAVNYGAFDASYTARVRKLVAAPEFSSYFSVIGFGDEGVVEAGGIQGQGRYGTQRYVSEHCDIVVNFSAFGYLYDAARWKTNDPNDPFVVVKGTGATFRGDSGGPYFNAGGVHDEGTDVTYFTNDLFGVHTTSDRGPDFKSWGTTNYGVALTDGELQWIRQSCLAVPEPATGALLAVLLLVARRHRNHRPGDSVTC